jgi:hypothetical protein
MAALTAVNFGAFPGGAFCGRHRALSVVRNQAAPARLRCNKQLGALDAVVRSAHDWISRVQIECLEARGRQQRRRTKTH